MIGKVYTGLVNLTERLTNLTGDQRKKLFQRESQADRSVTIAVADIIADVRAGGDAALRRLAARFDGVDLDSLEVPAAACTRALDTLAPPLRKAFERAAANISCVQRQSLPAASETCPEPGITIGRRPDPLARVGIYAPGGRASYPSSVLMGAIPARVAGVREIILCSPPGPDGLPAASVLAAAALAGVGRVFAIGGAGAIAAMAYGTETIPGVDRIVGPGNAYVAQAKLQVSGVTGIDSPAGPSELIVVADRHASAQLVAGEMIAQAEHDPAAIVIAVTVGDGVADSLLEALASGIPSQPRASIISASLAANGAVIEAATMNEAIDMCNAFAPEHLMLAIDDPHSILPRIRNAGTVFLGQSSSVSFGDYMTGANHVLPTGGLARSYSGLSVLDFVRWTTYQTVTPAAARSLADDVALFADAEGLHAHAAAARAWAAPSAGSPV